ncbi:proteasome assembly chaperone 2 isoform X2 [Prorops nasuta]|uniref:proteasome assembly chaperone 2 isoform X2 n=1 Tax=Prorops nasuta TaxID=863751 RepID=UPI0034CD2227
MIKLITEINLEGFTFVIPSVAVGNIAQLATDLLIENLNLQKIGHILDFSVIPVVGMNPFDENSEELCTALDLYANNEHKLIVLQVRSPVISNYTKFFEELKFFILKHKISQVVILTSSYAYQNSELKTIGLRYLVNDSFQKSHKDVIKKLEWVEHKAKINPFTNDLAEIEIPGGDAEDLISYFNQWSKLLKTNSNEKLNIKYPSSWKYLFGNPHPNEIY